MEISFYINTLIIFLCSWLSFFVPALAFSGLNAAFFTTRQITISLLISTLTGILLALILTVGYWFYVKDFSSNFNLANSIISLISGIIICLMNENAMQALFNKRIYRYIAFFIIILIMAVIGFFSIYIIFGILLIYLAFSVYDLSKNFIKPKTILFADLTQKDLLDISDIKFRMKPNIYLFFLESMNSAKTLKDLYNSDAGEKLAQNLAVKGLTIYPEAHANMDWTLYTRTNLFELTYTPQNKGPATKLRYPVITFDILKINGYSINIFTHATYIFGVLSDYADFCAFNEKLPPHIIRKFRKAAPLYAQSSFWRIFSDRHNPVELPDKIFGATRMQELLFNNIKHNSTPSFNIIYFGPSHAHYHQGENAPELKYDWIDEYRKRYVKSCQELEEYIDYIVKNDPDGVIIAMGDHGAHSLDKHWCLADNPLKAIESIGMKNIYYDLFSTFLAIKWPAGKEPENFIPSPINLFLFLFYELSENRELLKYIQKDYSMFSHKFKDFYIIAENGRLIDDIKFIDPFDSSACKNDPPTLISRYTTPK